MANDDLSWINSMVIVNQNNAEELKEALSLINSFQNQNEIDDMKSLKDSLEFVEFFIRNEPHLFNSEIRRITRYIRRLWFLDGEENKALNLIYKNYLIDLIKNILNDIYQENDLAKPDEQMKRCVFLISLFSYFYDDLTIYGICEYDYLFVSKLTKMIQELISKKLIRNNEIRPENLYRLIYLLDKIVSNWLDIINESIKDQYKKDFLYNLRNSLILRATFCKNEYKLISLSFATIVSNIRQIEAIIEASTK